MPQITIVYDNRASGNLRAGFGFAAHIRTNETAVLMDSGADKLVLEHNAAELGIQLDQVDALVISHDHCDHMGAMTSVFHKHLHFYIPKSASKRFERIGKAGLPFHPVDGPVEVAPNIRSTGQMGKQVPEQALIVDGEDGPILITGCAHMGIEELVERAIDLVGGPLSLVIGGFHLFQQDKEGIDCAIADLQALGVHRIAPCHCTGDIAIEAFREAFGEGFVPVEVGTRFAV